MKRARAAQDKEKRRQDFLVAASGLFDAGDYSSVTMSQIAAKAGLSKGTVYLYFKSKEELFLQLLVDELEEWFGQLTQNLPLMQGQPVAVFAKGFVATLRARPQLTRLLALMHLVLENQLDAESAKVFKLRLQGMMLPAGAQLERVLGMPEGQGLRLLLHAHALTVGLHQMTSTSPVVQEVVESSPELEPLRLDFFEELERAIEVLIRGHAGP
ncbi:MAG: AcrR family transcriptional regulator [Cognaticolwellia sp.]|jgi:AcrR family transcriptional regulator